MKPKDKHAKRKFFLALLLMLMIQGACDERLDTGIGLGNCAYREGCK